MHPSGGQNRADVTWISDCGFNAAIGELDRRYRHLYVSEYWMLRERYNRSECTCGGSGYLLGLIRCATLVALAAFLVAWHPRASAAPFSCPKDVLSGMPPTAVGPQLNGKTRVLCFSSFAVEHSAATRTPLWSAEMLTRARLKAAFALKTVEGPPHPESRLPQSERAERDDYLVGKYDRAALAPPGDMSRKQDRHEALSLANAVPLNPCAHQALWQPIEAAVRDLANREGELYVVTGPIFATPVPKRLRDRLAVPDSIFKAIYDPRRREAGAYVAPNDSSLGWTLISISELRDRAGVDVFPSLPETAKAKVINLPYPAVPHRCRVSRHPGPEPAYSGRRG